MKPTTKTQRTLVLTASLLGIIQSLAWLTMSILCIIQYNIETTPESPDSYIKNFQNDVYFRFLYKNTTLPDATIITPSSFTIFMWIYLVIDLIWGVISVFQIYAIQTTSANLIGTLKGWGVITCAICCIDLLLVIFIGCDYDENCTMTYQDPSKESVSQLTCTDSMIPVLVIAARGFILWLVNLVFGYLLFVITIQLNEDDVEYRPTSAVNERPKYRDETIPRATLQTQPSLYSQQVDNVRNSNNFWNVNLGTAFAGRTPPTTPASPGYANKQTFFAKS